MNIFVALGLLLLLWFGSKRPKFRFLAPLAFAFEFLIFREDALVIGSQGFYGILLMVIGTFWFLLYDKITKTKKA